MQANKYAYGYVPNPFPLTHILVGSLFFFPSFSEMKNAINGVPLLNDTTRR